MRRICGLLGGGLRVIVIRLVDGETSDFFGFIGEFSRIGNHWLVAFAGISAAHRLEIAVVVTAMLFGFGLQRA